jgi:hypothetical protein
VALEIFGIRGIVVLPRHIVLTFQRRVSWWQEGAVTRCVKFRHGSVFAHHLERTSIKVITTDCRTGVVVLGMLGQFPRLHGAFRVPADLRHLALEVGWVQDSCQGSP